MKTRLLLVAPVIAFAFSQLRAQELLSGPMVGHTTSNSAMIWVEADRPADVRVHYWLEPRIQYGRSLGEAIIRGVAEGRTADSPPHTGVVELRHLRPGWLVYYELELGGRPIRPETPQVFSLFPPFSSDGTIPNFAVAFTSCTFPARVPVQPIWNQIALHRPTALMLIGDNNYMPNHPGAYETDEDTVQYAMARYHRYLRDLPGLRSLLATTPSYGIWDDHDYGPNDSDRTFRWRELSLSLFKRYFPNPSAGNTETPGVFTSFRIADAEFFLLDNRFYRDPNNAADRKTMLGEGQLRWLRSSLTRSDATFKVIVAGGTMLVDRRGSGEYWANYGTERDDFLQWLFDSGITGVLFVVGDWHVGTISRLHRPHDRYPLYELLSSNAGVALPSYGAAPTGLGHARFHQFVGEEYLGFNFGLLRFSGQKGERIVNLEIIDENGRPRIQLALRENELKPWE